jgi:general secretion pathway protein I
MRERGFTLLEMLVATLIMGVAVVGLLSNINTSLRSADRLAGSDRAVLLARQKMDELLLDWRAPQGAAIEGDFDKAATGGIEAGWRARLTAYEAPPNPSPRMPVLERIQVEVWWNTGARTRTFTLEGFRRGVLEMPQ